MNWNSYNQTSFYADISPLVSWLLYRRSPEYKAKKALEDYYAGKLQPEGQAFLERYLQINAPEVLERFKSSNAPLDEVLKMILPHKASVPAMMTPAEAQTLISPQPSPYVKTSIPMTPELTPPPTQTALTAPELNLSQPLSMPAQRAQQQLTQQMIDILTKPKEVLIQPSLADQVKGILELGRRGYKNIPQALVDLQRNAEQVEKVKQMEWRNEGIRQLLNELLPTKIPARYPTGEEFGQWMLQGGQFPQIQPEETSYPTPEKYANIQARLSLLSGKPEAIMEGVADLNRIPGLIADAAYKLKQGQKVDKEIERIGSEINKTAEEINNLKLQGKKIEAETLEQSTINKYIPQLQELKVVNDILKGEETRARTGLLEEQKKEIEARTGLIGEQAKETKARTGLIGQRTQEAKARTGLIGEKIQTEKTKQKPEEKVKVPELTAAQKNRLSAFIITLQKHKPRRITPSWLWEINTRQKAEKIARELGLDPQHPEVKKVIDDYFNYTALIPSQATGTKEKVFEY